jgi:hypothetical protein
MWLPEVERIFHAVVNDATGRGRVLRTFGRAARIGVRLAVAAAVAAMAVTVAAGDTIDPNHDGSQYAWSETVGWLNGEPLGDGAPGARVLENRVEGWLWSENVGWISLSRVNTGSCGSVELRAQTEVPFPADPLFSDGFESGDTGAWSATVP